MLKAVIFDLDGVVADSHPIHEAAWKTLLVEQGLDSKTLNLDFLYAGHPRREILRHYLGSIEAPEIERLGARKDQLYALAANKLQAQPGIPRVLSQLNQVGILCALATSAGRARTNESLRHLGLTRDFSVIVTGEDVIAAKPAPDIFLLAAGKLAVAAKESVVVEDSVAGVVAARSAGMKCVGYALPRFATALAEAGADDVISDFPEDSPTYFEHLFTSNGSQRSALRHGSPPARGR
jgi:HAD superfamily hydrolase (TIGR01509 family)